MTTNKIPNNSHPAFTFVRSCEDFFEYRHKKNDLRVVFHRIADTKVVTANIVFAVGSKHEVGGQTGIAHMLEHMLFKPTQSDLAKKQPSSIMELERNTGAVINASTWKDRTNYYCTAPAEKLAEILTIQADQMQNVVITDKNLAPERTNVLSEYDMYNSNPYFALESSVSAVAFLAHPYRHETIGWRSDIEQYTAEKLNNFYHTHYAPNQATLIIVGDVHCAEALALVNNKFGKISKGTKQSASTIHEPVQEGTRRTTIVRPTTTNLVSISTKGPGFGTKEWTAMQILLKILSDGQDSILHRALVDTGKITAVEGYIYPMVEEFLATITCTLADHTSHEKIEKLVLAIIMKLTAKELAKSLKKTVAQICYAEPFARDSSSNIASELTEYVITDDWTKWCQTEKFAKEVSVKDLLTLRDGLFLPNKLTVGLFIGSEK